MSGASHVVLVTPGHLATNPRLVKEADALAGAGYRVTVVCARFIEWADRGDREFEARPWQVRKVVFGRMAGKWVHLWQALRQRAATWVFRATGRMASWAFHPAVPALTRAACALPADLYIAHNLAALPAAHAAARRHGARLGFDAEDFHRGEFTEADATSIAARLTRRLESRYLPGCDHLTAASPGIARAYAAACGIPLPRVVLNTFDAPPDGRPAGEQRHTGGPRLYWFSQTVGPHRGLEDAVLALSLARSQPSLALRGNPAPGYREALIALARQHGVADRLEFLPPAQPGEMVGLAAAYDLGLALEPADTDNQRICLSNKIFTFLSAQVPVLASPTPAQAELARSCGAAVRVCTAHSAAALAEAIDGLWLEPAAWAQAREAAVQAAARYDWATESRRFLDSVRACLATRGPRILALFGNVPLLGQERANIETMDALARQGCAVKFLIRGEYTADSIQAELNRRGLMFRAAPYFDTMRRGVPARVWWRNAKGLLGGSLVLLQEIRRFRATHLHAGSTSNVLNFLPALWLTRVPLVYRAGDLPPQHHALWRWVWRYARRRASFVVCDSEFVRTRLVALGLHPAKAEVIYAPPPGRTAGRHAIALESSPGLSVLYLGQVTEPKGVHLLVEAALAICRERADIRFLIAGDHAWRNPFAEGLIGQVDQAGLSSRIRFLGFVEDVPQLMAVAHVHVCPSLVEEGYGLTVIEAKAHGLPSIVFPSGALAELVRDGEDGSVCAARSAQELKHAIERYLAQPALAREQGRRARQSLVAMRVDQFGARWRGVYDAA